MNSQLLHSARQHWPQITAAPQLIAARENTVYRVDTTQGPHALRLHRAGYHDSAALLSELNWMAALASAGFEVPQPLPARDGALLVDLGPRHASLLNWANGTPLGQSGAPLAQQGPARAATFHRLGRQIARLHALADQWTPPPNFARPVWDSAGLVGAQPLWGAFWQIDHPAAPRLHQIRDIAQARLAAYRPQADYGLIHADLVRENVLVDGETLRFIDFDDCGYGFRLFDLATALLKNHAEPDYLALQTALLQGYQTLRPLTAADLAMLPLFLILRSLSYIGWAAARPDLPDQAARIARYTTTALALIASDPGLEM